MRYRRDRRWPRRRTRFPAATDPRGGRLAGTAFAFQNDTVMPDPTPDPLAALKAEPPGPDGVRTALVARVRQMIARGEYDTPERWAEAEARLFDRLAGDH